MKNRYKIIIEPLSALHIGTGEEIGLDQYFIKDNMYYRYDTTKVIEYLNDSKREEFIKLIDNNKFKDIAKFLSENCNEKAILYKIPVSNEVKTKYYDKSNSLENQMLICEQYRSIETKKPVIPGSSIKGAIRTAIIDWYSNNFSIDDKKNQYGKFQDFEKKILNYTDPKNDPFRAISITDSEIYGKNIELISDSKIFYKSKEPISIQMIKEYIIGEIIGGEAKGEFELTIDKELLNSHINSHTKFFRFNIKLSIMDIIESCNSFYKKNFSEELKKFYNNNKDLEETGNNLKNIIDKIDGKKGVFLIRVGRHSQVENVTIHLRKPEAKKGAYGNTRTLTEDLYPFGWCKLTVLNWDKINDDEKTVNLRTQNKSLNPEDEFIKYVNKDQKKEIKSNNELSVKGKTKQVSNINKNLGTVEKKQEIENTEKVQPEINKIYKGRVTNITDFGIFVNFGFDKDGMIYKKGKPGFSHIKKGDEIKVKFIGFNKQGKYNLELVNDDNQMKDTRMKEALKNINLDKK